MEGNWDTRGGKVAKDWWYIDIIWAVLYTDAMNSKQKGSIAVAQCIAKLYKLGFEVLLPIGDRNPYDLVFDDGKKLNKVQVKFAGKRSRGGYRAGLRVTGGNQSFNYAKKYNKDAFDYLFVYSEDGRSYLIEWNDIEIRNEIKIDYQVYKKYLVWNTRGGRAANRTRL